jgi:hypothetical protein
MTQCVGEFFEVHVRPVFQHRPGEPSGENTDRFDLAQTLAHAAMSGIEHVGGPRSTPCEELGSWIMSWTGEELWEEMEDCDEDCED